METIILACVTGGLIAVPAALAIRWYVAEDEHRDSNDASDSFGR